MSLSPTTPPKNTGYLKVIVGPMFAGKTSEMTEDIVRWIFAKRKCVIVKFGDDTRYDHLISAHDKGIVTHAGAVFDKCPIVSARALADIANNPAIATADVIGISEGQFFPDVAECANAWAKNKIVIVEGLSGTFRQEPFGDMPALMAKADEIKHVTAVCMICSNRYAPFTARLTDDAAEVIIGGSEMYVAVCRECIANKAKK